MTFSGKNLQDIYNSGADKLVELEKGGEVRLQQAAEGHDLARKQGENGSVARVEERAGQLESELRTFLEQSNERLQKVLETELKETADQLETVKTDLSSQSARLKTSILALKRSYEESMEHLRISLSDEFEATMETSSIDLERQDHTSNKQVRAHGTHVLNALQQKLDHSLWESRGEEKQYNSSLFKTFMQKANSIDTHFSSLMQKLSSDFQQQFKVLEARTQQAEPDLVTDSQAILSGIEASGNEFEQAINQFFKRVLDEHNNSLDNNLSNIAQDLSSVHDATTERLSEQTRQLSSSLVTASGEARDALIEKCENLRKKVDATVESFNTGLDEKLENRQTFRHTLENERNEIYRNIRTELNEIRVSFDQRLTELMTESVERVNQVAVEAEADMNNTFAKCDALIQEDGDSAKAEIDQAISEFLMQAVKHRRNALEQISMAAGATNKPEGSTDLRER